MDNDKAADMDTMFLCKKKQVPLWLLKGTCDEHLWWAKHTWFNQEHANPTNFNKMCLDKELAGQRGSRSRTEKHCSTLCPQETPVHLLHVAKH